MIHSALLPARAVIVVNNAGQFTALRTLSVDCGGKACGDFEALRLMKQLRRLRLSYFSMADEAFAQGLGCCHGLEALYLDSQQVCMCVLGLGGRGRCPMRSR